MAASAAGYGGLRASDADRDRAVDVLRAAFLQGRLTEGELATRTDQALRSRTFGELTAVTAGLLDVQPLTPGRKAAAKKVAAWSACMIIPPVLAAAFLSYYGGFIVLLVLAFIGTVITGAPAHDSARRR